MKENHTFDNYFGSFPGAEGTQMAQTSTGPIAVGRPPVQLTRDLCHEHSCALADWNSGGMDHWDLGDTNNASDQLAFTQYLEDDIPNYWQYARHFGLADHFFAGMLGPSFPGHMFVLAAQTGWALGNPDSNSVVPLVNWGCDDPAGSTQSVLDKGSCTVKAVSPCYDFPTVVDGLPPAVTWKFYGSTLPPVVGEVWSMLDGVQHIRMTDAWKTNVVDASTFDADVDSGNLASIVFLVDQDLNSEHPPFNICSGENWTVGHLNHVMQSPLWQKTAILMTWDDFGGWYDHVAPPVQYGWATTRRPTGSDSACRSSSSRRTPSRAASTRARRSTRRSRSSSRRSSVCRRWRRRIRRPRARPRHRRPDPRRPSTGRRRRYRCWYSRNEARDHGPTRSVSGLRPQLRGTGASWSRPAPSSSGGFVRRICSEIGLACGLTATSSSMVRRRLARRTRQQLLQLCRRARPSWDCSALTSTLSAPSLPSTRLTLSASDARFAGSDLSDPRSCSPATRALSRPSPCAP